MGNWQKWPSRFTRWGNIQNQSQPIPVANLTLLSVYYQLKLTDKPFPDGLRVAESPAAVPALELGGLGVLHVGVLVHLAPAPEGLAAHSASSRRVDLLFIGGKWYWLEFYTPYGYACV